MTFGWLAKHENSFLEIGEETSADPDKAEAGESPFDGRSPNQPGRAI